MQTETKAGPTVRCFEASARFRAMTRVANVFVRPLLRSSAGRGSTSWRSCASMVGERQTLRGAGRVPRD